MAFGRPTALAKISAAPPSKCVQCPLVNTPPAEGRLSSKPPQRASASQAARHAAAAASAPLDCDVPVATSQIVAAPGGGVGGGGGEGGAVPRFRVASGAPAASPWPGTVRHAESVPGQG